MDQEQANSAKDSEVIFLQELISRFTFWKKKAKEKLDGGFNNERELEYAEAYKILLNKFTLPEIPIVPPHEHSE